MKKIFIMLLVFISALQLYSKKPFKKINTKSQRQIMLEKKLRDIKIKHIEFEEAEPIAVFKYLRLISKKNDPEGKGVNIITTGLSQSKKKITLLLDDIPLADVIKYVCQVASLQYKVEDFAIIISPKK